MGLTILDEQFFESTRGRIVSMLRGTSSTVEELADKLELTDNAVRAHLATLGRDGLIQQNGARRGIRKPHYTYALTPEAEQLFPKAYDALLNQLVEVLKGRLAPETLETILREVGRNLAQQNEGPGHGDLESRLRVALKVLEALGGSPAIERQGDMYFIRSGGCPLSTVVAKHPEVCQLAETLVAEILKRPVQEQCQREPTPRCSFAVKA